MRRIAGLLLVVVFGSAGGVSAADLGIGAPALRPDGYGSPLRYGRLYDPHGPHGQDGPRPRRRVMGDQDYVGSTFGLGRPAFSGIGPRPDWGRSSYD